MFEQELLDEYKKYDYLNKKDNNPLCKILVSYIKPSFLFKSEILTPIHLGRMVAKENSKDGKISQNDVNWLYENCIGDDNFEDNISIYNRRVGFLTGTYWAWKNYELLGSPTYLGSCGYRKLFSPDCLKKIENVDAIIPAIEENANNRTNMERYLYSRDKNMVNLTIKVMEKFHKEDLKLFYEYFGQKFGYYHEMYIFKQNIFFDFCNWIFPMMFELLNYKHEDFMPEREKMNLVQQVQSTYDKRDIAFVIERLTGFYCYKLVKNPNLSVKSSPYHIFRNKEDDLKEKLKVINILRIRNKDLKNTILK